MLIERIVQAIVAAQASLRPAQLQAGIARQEGLSFNRRFWMKNGKVVFNPGQLNPDIVRPAGPIDPDVGILLARSPNATQPFAGLTVFAVHSDTVGGTEYSADYPYFLEQTLRERLRPATPLRLGPRHVRRPQPHQRQREARPAARSSQITRAHRQHARARWSSSSQRNCRSSPQPALAARSTTIQVPFHQATPEQVADARAVMEKFYDASVPFLTKVAAVRTLDLAGLGPLYPMEVQVFRLDADTAIVCLPCEIFVELGLAIKRASPFKQTLVIEICNDRPSYVPTLKAFGEGSYEVTNARVKPGAGEMLVDAAVKLLKEVKR